MKTTSRFLFALLAPALSLPLLAQPEPSASVATLKPFYLRVQGYVVKTAEAVPDDVLEFKPTEEVRSVRQMLAHIANAQFMMCSMALGEENPSTSNFEETAVTKADIIDAIARSNEVCNRAYEMSDADAGRTIQMFGNEMPALSALILNYGHAYEHYANLITYLRMNGMVPPSSQRG